MPEREEGRMKQETAMVAGDEADPRSKGPRDGLTSEQVERLHALTHPEGDPYTNARDLGFYCEQCG